MQIGYSRKVSFFVSFLMKIFIHYLFANACIILHLTFIMLSSILTYFWHYFAAINKSGDWHSNAFYLMSFFWYYYYFLFLQVEWCDKRCVKQVLFGGNVILFGEKIETVFLRWIFSSQGLFLAWNFDIWEFFYINLYIWSFRGDEMGNLSLTRLLIVYKCEWPWWSGAEEKKKSKRSSSREKNDDFYGVTGVWLKKVKYCNSIY